MASLNGRDNGARRKSAEAWAARAEELRSFSAEHLQLARQRHLEAIQARWRMMSKRYDRSGPVLGMAPGKQAPLWPPSQLEVGDLVAQAEAIWLTLASCRTLVDGESETMITTAMDELDNVARAAHVLSPGERSRLRNDLREIDEIATTLCADLHRAPEQHDGP